jgi:beta-phosphoglucomutase-like phosphatase (HAD superfamily)
MPGLKRKERGEPLVLILGSIFFYSTQNLHRYNRHGQMFQHMKAIVAGDDPAVNNGKPAPDIYLEAARRLNVDPKECLVFEDALSGVRSGKAAGCYVVAIPDPRFSEEEKKVFAKEADVVVDSLWQFDGTKFGLGVDMNSNNN